MEGERFQIFGEVDFSTPLVKSQAGEASDPYLVRMRIMNAVRDNSGELPLLQKSDFSELDHNGYIKYEHDPYVINLTKSGTTTISSFPTAKNNIGGVLSREMSADGKSTTITGRLFPYMEETKHVMNLMKSIQEWNELYPHKKRTLQCSVEGSYLSKSKTGEYIAKVANVAITPQAQDETTWVEQASQANLALAKSLAAGAAASIGEKKDGAALEKEDVEGKTNKETKFKEKKMKKFMSRHDAKIYHSKKGLKGKELDDAVDKEFEDEDKVAKDDKVLEKSKLIDTTVTTLRAELEKSMRSLTDQSNQLMQNDTQLKKSNASLRNGEKVDGAEYLATAASGIIAGSEANITNAQVLLKSADAVLSILGSVSELHKSQDSKITLALERLADLSDRMASMASGMRLAKSSIQTSGLEEHEIAAPPARDHEWDGVSVKQVENFLANRAENEERTGNKELAKSYWSEAAGVKINGLDALSKSHLEEVKKRFIQAA